VYAYLRRTHMRQHPSALNATHAPKQGTRKVFACEFPRKNFFRLYRQTLKKIGSVLAKGRPKGTPFPVKDPKKQLPTAFICM
jgi:hypothetical protein